MNKKVLYGSKARAAVLAGVKKLAEAVKTTLGPSGRNVLIAQSIVHDYNVHSLPIHITKDGYNTTKSFDLDDPFEKVGVIMGKECAQKSVDQSGDGTSTTILLLEAILESGVEMVENGSNPMELKKQIDKAVEHVVFQLKEMAIPVKGSVERIRQIATISGNNDPEIGDWIAKAFEKIGDEGTIDLEASKGVTTEIKISDGYKWNKGLLSVSPLFANNKEKQICEFIDPLILLYEKRLQHFTQIENALKIAIQNKQPIIQPIIIICEQVDSEVLGFLVMNNAQGKIKCCVVESPSFGLERAQDMEDLAILTGATYISDIKGVGIKEIELSHFGTCQKVIVNKDETIIIGGDVESGKLDKLLSELRANLADAKSENEKSPIEKRIAKLTGSIAVIKVGAATETEMKEKMDRFDDAVRATKSALAEGFVPGSGTAFLNTAFKTDDNGVKVVEKSLKQPLLQICKNAGIDGKKAMEFVMESGDSHVGYNAKTDTVENLVDAGVIDPVKVLRCALQNAASTAGMILTSEVLIVDVL